MPDRSEEKIISFIDLGTNSIRLLIARIYSNHSYSIIRQQKDTVRLGEGSFAEGRIFEEAIGRAIDLCGKYVEISRNFNVNEIHAVATSAARDAVNGRLMIQRIKAETGLDIKIISGKEEARLIYLGVSNNLNPDDGLCMFIDIGGGSTEIIIGSHSDYSYLNSIKLGALRTHYHFMNDLESGVIGSDKRAEIISYVKNRMIYSKNEILDYSVSKVYGSSGTIKALISIAEKNQKRSPSSNKEDCAGILEIEDLMLMLCEMSTEDRRNIQGINPERADIIATGAIILHTIMKELNIEKIYSTDSSLRDGLLIDFLSNRPGFTSSDDIPIKEKSIRHLGKLYRINESHAEKIVELSKQLFTSAKECGLHNYGTEELELLEYAAYLHDIGQSISFSKHQNHSYYIISNVDLPGFNQTEQELIGLIARYHRKKIPGPTDKTLKNYDQATVKMITVLSLFLRIAEHLDRSHDGRVKIVYFSKDEDSILLNVESDADCSIELWATTEDLPVIEKTFHQKTLINKFQN